VDIIQAVENIRLHLEAVKADAIAKLEQDLPGLQSFAKAASENPAVAALSVAVHLPQAPEFLAVIADFIGKADAALGAAKAQGAAEAAQPPAEAAQPPAEPAV
jgi:hypothetical protein